MFIFPAVCRHTGKKALTLIETIVVIIIFGVVAAFSTGAWRNQIEIERQNNAKEVLKILWRAEESYFAWKNVYTVDWASLAVQDPNITDKFYTFTLEEASGRTLTIRAACKGGGGGFTIDQDGAITKF
ncbi:MAG: prepilin-type N-terminal cleavage/methylation domain-containing protein [Candidatus Omnitrophota bacterium]|jgi:prepilin-type N-terminal cleavage/methylation domain-containing protein